jgi:hypothetical protein
MASVAATIMSSSELRRFELRRFERAGDGLSVLMRITSQQLQIDERSFAAGEELASVDERLDVAASSTVIRRNRQIPTA